MEFCRVNGTIPNDPYPDRPLRHPIYPYLMVFCKRGGICKRCATVDTFYSRRCDACEKFLDGESYTTRKVSKYGIFLVRIFSYSLQIRENTDQKNSTFGYFSCSVSFNFISWKLTFIQEKWTITSRERRSWLAPLLNICDRAFSWK